MTDGPDRPAAQDEPATAEHPPVPAADGALEAYIRENRASYTEPALRAAAIAAGHRPADVDAALTATRGPAAVVDRGRAVRNVFLAYLGVYLVLDVLMLINPANQGEGFLGDVRGLGIVILSVALGAGFVASLVWIASPRAFWFLLGCGIVVYGVSLMTGYQPALVLTLGVSAIGIAILAGAPVYKGQPGRAPSVELVMSIPLLILLAVGGVCVASGLPIPRPG